LQAENNSSGVGCVIAGIIILIFAFGLFSNCINSDDHTDKVSIVTAVQDRIKKGLLNPDGASFSSIDDTTMTKNDDGTYEVDGYVDDTNGFGAKIRNNYKATVKVEDDGYIISYRLQNPITGEWQ